MFCDSCPGAALNQTVWLERHQVAKGSTHGCWIGKATGARASKFKVVTLAVA